MFLVEKDKGKTEEEEVEGHLVLGRTIQSKARRRRCLTCPWSKKIKENQKKRKKMFTWSLVEEDIGKPEEEEEDDEQGT